ncbi:pyroglutamyl-peptidase I [Anoxybacter fermentans]|uniref:Pyrrolidone-carboxylate peptidase n=1 Tax=Anoxybacter fermentans TaxID=1323375 RepID=A0A3Q9HR75_9FIRM|nr:pyroglutamyl-peptidase I [Anoxybacter fermentans]AZR73829.1 pyroglutamyl-peptidase I [Anoxybacter fermentans]
MKKVLLSGFEPFGGESINPSLKLIKRLENERWDDVEVHLVQLPVVFGESIKKLKKVIDEVDPDLVIGIGQAGGRTALSIERVAINVDDAVIADNEGNQPIDRPINSKGPAAYFSTLPIKRMMKAAREAGVPAMISNSAGTYVCNHLMYGILDLLAGTDKLGGFIHIPYLPEQVVDRPLQPSMALETMVKGIKAMVMAAVSGDKDDKIAAGALD